MLNILTSLSSPPQYTGLKIPYRQLSGLFLGKRWLSHLGPKSYQALPTHLLLKSLETGNIDMSVHPFIHPSSIHPSIHLSNQHLLNCYYVPGTMIGAGETLLNKAVMIPVCWEFTVSWGRQAVSKSIIINYDKSAIKSRAQQWTGENWRWKGSQSLEIRGKASAVSYHWSLITSQIITEHT